MTIITGVICLFIGGIVTYFIIKPKLKVTAQKNTEIDYINSLAEKKNGELEKRLSDLTDNCDKVQERLSFYKKQTEEFESILLKQEEIEKHSLDSAKEECLKEYQIILKDMSEHFSKETKSYVGQLAKIREELDVEKSRAQAVIKEYFEEKQKATSFTIPLTENAKADIKRLREIQPLIFEKDVVSKIIWKGYIEKPLGKMLKMFHKSAEISGIYKIVCGTTGEVYIGQAVNIADRFKQHIKKGLGIEMTKTKLYETMFKYGVEDFTFEILEPCPQEKLNQEEKYWIEFYNSKEYGLNTLGGIK